MGAFNPSLFAMARKQELMDAEIKKNGSRNDRLIPSDSAAIVVSMDSTNDFVTITLMGTEAVQQEGEDIPLAVLVAMQALALLEKDLDDNLRISLPTGNEEPS